MKRTTFISRRLQLALAAAGLAAALHAPAQAANPPAADTSATNAPSSGTNAASSTNATAAPGAGLSPAFGQVKNFFVPDYYDPPNQNQMKSLLRGAEAEPQPNGCVLIHELQLETYGIDGRLQMSVHAPVCSYNSATQSASSSSHIEARSGDGHLLIEGEGFLWKQTNSTFTVSNRVHTIIRQEPDKSPTI
jgi:hypothetical protein